jgi:hypothetical protein
MTARLPSTVVVFVPCAGSPEPLRRLRPRYPGPVKTKRAPWPLRQGIPDQQEREALREAARKTIRETRAMIEAALSQGQRILAA